MRWGWYVTWQRQQKQCSFHIWCPVPLEPAKCKRNTKHLNLQATKFHSWLIKLNYRRTPSCLWVWSHRIQQERPEPSRATPKYLSSVWSKMHYPWWVDSIFGVLTLNGLIVKGYSTDLQMRWHLEKSLSWLTGKLIFLITWSEGWGRPKSTSPRALSGGSSR